MIKRVVRDIGHYFKRLHFQDEWRKKNKHNFTIANEIFNINKVAVGKATYGNLNVRCYGNELEKLVIGNYCSISDEVHFILGGNHNYKKISTYPIKNKLLDQSCEAISKGPIIIEDDVWIGFGCIILSGVTIGKGSIIGAGSVVSKDIPPYSVFVANRIIKQRFSDKILDKIKKIDFSKLENNDLVYNLDIFDVEINENNIDEIMNKIGL